MIKLIKITPMSTAIITTADRYGEIKTVAGIIDDSKSGSLKEFQKVLSIGSMVRVVKVGDLVCLNPSNYAVHKFNKGETRELTEAYNPVTRYNFNFMEINNEVCIKFQENDVDFIVDEFEEIEDIPEPIIKETQGTQLILPSKPRFNNKSIIK